MAWRRALMEPRAENQIPTWRHLAASLAATLIATAILISLGIWQLERLHWKRGLLARIAAAEQAPPLPLARTTPPLFARVSVQGTLRPQAALYGADVRGDGNAARMGAQLLELLDRESGPPVLVDLGWVPTEHGQAPRPVVGPVSLTAYIRLPERPGWLSAPDDPEQRHFYALDPAPIAASLGAPQASGFTLVVLSPAPEAGPQPAAGLPQPVNNHLQYAFTWFGLAAALIGVFLFWARSHMDTPRKP